MYTVKLSSEEIELLLSALRYTTEYGYTLAQDNDWKEMVQEQTDMYRVYDKLVELR